MPKYLLKAKHILNMGGQSVEVAAGTEIGDGTPYPFDDEPTPDMEGLDAEGKQRVAAVLDKLYRQPPSHYNPDLVTHPAAGRPPGTPMSRPEVPEGPDMPPPPREPPKPPPEPPKPSPEPPKGPAGPPPKER
jgi:hypothetical protein